MYSDPTGLLFFSSLLGSLAVLLFSPIGGILTQTLTSVASYIGIAAASVWDKTIRDDMQAIGWNPFNTDEQTVLQSNKVSFYKGVPIFRTGSNRSGSFLAIFLRKGASAKELKHEWGHIPQQLLLGPGTFGLTIGLPSGLEWSTREYYDRPWEITADILGGVTERSHSQSDITRGFSYLYVSSVFNIFAYLFLIGEYL